MDNLIDFTLYNIFIPFAVGFVIGLIWRYRRPIQDRIKSILAQIDAGNGPI